MLHFRKGSNTHLFDYHYNEEDLNTIDGVVLDLSFKNVMSFFDIIQERRITKNDFVNYLITEKGFSYDNQEEELNLNNYNDDQIKGIVVYYSIIDLFKVDEDFLSQEEIGKKFIEKLSQLLNSSRYTTDDTDDAYIKFKKGLMTKEQYNKIQSSKEKYFDFSYDFDLIYALFLEKFRIDLINEDINYFKFLALLESLMLEENSLTSRIEKRSFKKQKGKAYRESNKIGEKLKRKYKI